DSAANIISRFHIRDNLVRRFFRDEAGRTWLATAKEGLGFWDRDSGYITYFNAAHGLQNNHVFDIAPAGNGNLWISSYGGGLHFFDARKKMFQPVISANLGEGICTDTRGNVWMISNGDLHRYDVRTRQYATFHLPDLRKSGSVKGKLFRDGRGYLYAGGTGYMLRFHPDSVQESHEIPNVVLTGFSVFNQPKGHLLNDPSIRLRQKENYITFEFAAPYFAPGADVYYSYKLDGFDDDWIETSRNYVSYSNLPGGSYTFRVRASRTPGMWPADHAAAVLEIIPPVWKRGWFIALSALALLVIAYMIYRYRINELLQRQSIRNRIAQDLHDNVGSTLSSISVYSQVARIYHTQHRQTELQSTLEKISSTSSDMISELNDTVWAINPRNDHMEVIIQKMESFARPLLVTQQIRFSLQVQPAVYAVNLDMDQRKNFYLVFKEAINNILKYANATSVTTTIEVRDRWMHMTVEDDGRGFNVSDTSEGYKSSDVFGGGNGLKNMQLRAAQLGGSLQIDSQAGRGTSIRLKFPVS
ncbi:MAG TPA: ATP-binding protein, partial [Flavisolibacter sp.]